MKLTINSNGVFLDDVEIPRCLSVDIKNISQTERMEAVLHVVVDETDVQFKPYGMN